MNKKIAREGSKLEVLVLVGGFIALMMLGVPVAVSMGLSSLSYILFFSNLPATIAISKMTSGLDSFSFIAAPLFILTALLMNESGVTEKLFNFARALVGHFRGGLGHVNILASMIFAGMSADPLSDTAGLGLIEIKSMKEAGYPADFSAAVTAASARLGPIIPPSMIMVIYASLMEVSVGKMLLAGLIPGLLLGIAFILTVFVIAHVKKHPKEGRASLKIIMKTFIDALLPMMTPVIIVGGILFGIFTPTEAAAVACLYAFILGFFIYKGLTIRTLISVLIETIRITGIIAFIVSAAFIFGYLVTITQLPQTVVSAITNTFSEKWVVLLLMNVFFLLAGCILTPLPIMISCIAVLFPLIDAYNIDPIHLGVFMILNLEIGGLTPPMAISMYIVSTVAETPFIKVLRAVTPFYIPLLAVLGLITYYPQIVLFLPNLF